MDHEKKLFMKNQKWCQAMERQASWYIRKGNHLIHSKRNCDCWKFEKA